jgi:RNA polymerase sigma-70 factor (ECF subfamily)
LQPTIYAPEFSTCGKLIFGKLSSGETEQFYPQLPLNKRMAEMTDQKQEVFWVLRAQSGDVEAFDALLKSVQGQLFRYVDRLVGERVSAEDILQEVFLLIYRKIRWLENPKRFRAWAYRIASREAFRYLKREKHWTEQVRDEKVLETIPFKSAEEIYEPELIGQLPQLISEISPASRAVLILHYLDELPLSEVAEILDISPGTAKSRLAYGLDKLRQKIKKEN